MHITPTMPLLRDLKVSPLRVTVSPLRVTLSIPLRVTLSPHVKSTTLHRPPHKVMRSIPVSTDSWILSTEYWVLSSHTNVYCFSLVVMVEHLIMKHFNCINSGEKSRTIFIIMLLWEGGWCSFSESSRVYY